MTRSLRSLAPPLEVLFFVSGFSSLVLEVVYVHLLRCWTGNTASAIAAVLCAYMAGLALGSQAAGRWLVARRGLLALYAGMELAVGVYSLALPWLMQELEPAYLGMTRLFGPDAALAVLAQFLASSALLLLPTVLMGASFPVVVRAASRAPADQPGAAERLYFSNLAGAAIGALLADFLLIAAWGSGTSLRLVALVNAGVAGGALMRSEPTSGLELAGNAAVSGDPPARRDRGLILFLALAGGFLVLFQEIVWTQMVGQFLDSSAYGFAVALFGVIAGLGLGALLVTRQVVKVPPQALLPWSCLGAGLLLVLLIPFWDNARHLAEKYPAWSVYTSWAVVTAVVLIFWPQPKAFAASFGVFVVLAGATLLFLWLDNSRAQFWVFHEVELAVVWLFMMGPAVLMGMIFPLVLDWYLRPANPLQSTVAPLYAANTVGSLAGILTATFLVLPLTGVERAGRWTGLAMFALGAALLARQARRRLPMALAMLPVLAWVWYFPRWDYSKPLALEFHTGRLAYAQEDLNAGVVTVLDSAGERNLYVNGLVQAGTGVLIRDQTRFALVPLLYVHEFGRATVIGVGSGQTAGVVAQFPFQGVDIVELSPRVAEAARRYFGDLNFGLFTNPRVKLHIADGRHYLLTHPEKLSLLTIELSRLWVAGEGDLYTREFYQLCSRRLTDRGVLQQWLPLFDLSLEDTVIILRTVRMVFPYVNVYFGIESGMIVASRSPLVVDAARLHEMDTDPKLANVLGSIGLPSVASLLGDCVLVSQGLDGFLEQIPERRISTDLSPHLEYSNARFYLGNRSSSGVRRRLLNAQEFRIPPVSGLDPAKLADLRAYALEERERLPRTLAVH